MRTPKDNSTSDEILKAKEDLNNVRSATHNLDKKRKEKENKAFEKITRFVARKLNKGKKNLRSAQNNTNGTIQSQTESAFLAKSTFLAFLYSQGSEYCLKQDLTNINPNHCPAEYERVNDPTSVCRSLCPNAYSSCGSICYQDCTHKCLWFYDGVKYMSTFAVQTGYFLAFGPCSKTVRTSGTQCIFSFDNSNVTRASSPLTYIYNTDSRVLCSNEPVFSFKSNDKCYKSCTAINMKDCSVSLCGKDCVSGSDKFNLETLTRIRTGIDVGLTVNSNSTFSPEFLDFFTNQFKTSSFSTILSSVVSTVTGLVQNDWIFKYGNSSKSNMPDTVAGRFINSSWLI